jgi:heme A synthase
VLSAIHTWSGYAVFIVVLATAVTAYSQAKYAREFTASRYVLALVLLDVQVLIGFVTYAVGGFWDANPEIAYLHPALALAALGSGHMLMRAAKATTNAEAAHRQAGKALIVALVLITAAIGVASAPPFIG